MRSKFEGAVYKNLQAYKRQFDYEIDYETEQIEYTLKQTYTPDFIITTKDGRKIYIEAKGYWDGPDRRKLKMVMLQHPELDIRLVFQNNPKIHKSSNTRYSDYCQRHNIIYCIGEIPKEWFE